MAKSKIFENDKSKTVEFGEEDFLLIISPQFQKKLWDGRINLSAVTPSKGRLKKKEYDQLSDVIDALLTCFRLLNTDDGFAQRVREELNENKKYYDHKYLNSSETKDNNVKKKLSPWTKTVGNA